MKTGNTKKILAKVFAVTMAFSLVFATGCGDKGKSESEKEAAFINSIGGVSETYTGTVSDVSYETAKAAAQAYVEEELIGDADCDVTKIESKGALSNNEVMALGLPSEITTGMTGIEKLEVQYTKEDDSDMYYTAAASDTLNKNEKVTVYVIKYESRFKYYTPCPITGETITKSYYDSIFNVDKYKNCTYATSMDMDMTISVSAQGQSQKVSMEMSSTQLFKYSANEIYVEQTTSYEMSYGGQDMTEEETIYAYIEMLEDELVCYVKEAPSTEWKVGSLKTVGFSNLEELTPFYEQYLDYSYFTKTDYGFQLSEENAQRFIDETLSDVLDQMDVEDMINMFDIDMFAKYYVSQGVLSGMREDVTMKMNATESGVTMKMNADIVAEMSCKDYGTTVVTKPFTE